MLGALAILVICAAAWLIGWVTQRSAPAGFDFIAIYASARLVSTGQGASVTDTVTISVAALAAAALQRSARLRLM